MFFRIPKRPWTLPLFPFKGIMVAKPQTGLPKGCPIHFSSNVTVCPDSMADSSRPKKWRVVSLSTTSRRVFPLRSSGLFTFRSLARAILASRKRPFLSMTKSASGLKVKKALSKRLSRLNKRKNSFSFKTDSSDFPFPSFNDLSFMPPPSFLM